MAGKYTPLENYLRGLPDSQKEVSLGFQQIERILKSKLPSSAYEDQRWWDKRDRGQPCQRTRLDKCRLEDRECGCQPEAGEDDAYQVRASVGDRGAVAECVPSVRRLGGSWDFTLTLTTCPLQGISLAASRPATAWTREGRGNGIFSPLRF